jgi:hypothetical protein
MEGVYSRCPRTPHGSPFIPDHLYFSPCCDRTTRSWRKSRRPWLLPSRSSVPHMRKTSVKPHPPFCLGRWHHISPCIPIRWCDPFTAHASRDGATLTYIRLRGWRPCPVSHASPPQVGVHLHHPVVVLTQLRSQVSHRSTHTLLSAPKPPRARLVACE